MTDASKYKRNHIGKLQYQWDIAKKSNIQMR